MSKKILQNFGYHISSRDLSGDNKLTERITEYGLGWSQFFLGNPRSYSPGDPTIKRVKESTLDLKHVVHGPYIVNIVDDSRDVYNRSVECIAEELTICSKLGIKSYVTHLGSVAEETPAEKVVEKLEKSCQEILEQVEGELKTTLLLETSPGSASGTRIGTLQEVTAVARKFDQNVGICLDTEHAYANGLNLNNFKPENYIDQIEVVHLNSIPEEVDLNSHRDVHGEVLLAEASDDIAVSLDELTKYFNQQDIPLIMERSSAEVIDGDLEYLANLLD